MNTLDVGSFGTDIPQILAENVENFYLLARNKKRADINMTHENKWYHPRYNG